MSKNEKRLMLFLLRHPEDWHSIGKDSRATVRTLARHGLVEIHTPITMCGTGERLPWQARLIVGERARAALAQDIAQKHGAAHNAS